MNGGAAGRGGLVGADDAGAGAGAVAGRAGGTVGADAGAATEAGGRDAPPPMPVDDNAGVRRGTTNPCPDVPTEEAAGAADAAPADEADAVESAESADSATPDGAVAPRGSFAPVRGWGAGAGAIDRGAGAKVLEGVGRDAGAANSGCASALRAMVITPPQTEQRARTLAAGTLSGSTRKIERHSGHTTFMPSLPSTRQRPDP